MSRRSRFRMIALVLCSLFLGSLLSQCTSRNPVSQINLFSLVTASPAIAQVARPPSQKARQAADRLFQTGLQQFNQQQFDAAIATWKNALSAYQALVEPSPSAFTPSSSSPSLNAAILQGIAATQQNLLAVYLQQHHLDAAIALLPQQAAIHRQLGQEAAAATADYTLANLYAQQGRYRKAIAPYERSLAYARDSYAQDQNGQRLPIVLGNLAIAYKVTGQYRAALQANSETLKLLEQHNRQSLRSKVLRNQGNVYESLGDYKQATLLFQESLAIAEKLGDVQGQAIAWNSLGGVAANEGDTQRAVEAYRTSIGIATAAKDDQSLGSSWLNWGAVSHQQGNFPEALDRYQKSLAIAKQLSNRKLEAEALGSLGVVHDSQGKFDQAVAFLRRSLAISREMGDRPSESTTLNNLGHALYAAGNLSEAETTLRATLAVLDELRQGLSDLDKVSLFDTQAKTYNLLQQVLIAQKRPEQALEVAEWGRGRAFADLLVQRSETQPSEAHTQLLAQAAQPPNLQALKKVARSQRATLVEYTLVPQDDFVHQGKQLGVPAAIYIWVIQPDGRVSHRQADLQPLIEQQQSLDNLVRLSRCFEADVICRRRLRRSRGDRGSRFVDPLPEPTPHPSPSLEVGLAPQTKQGQGAAPKQRPTASSSRISQRHFSALQDLHSVLIDPIADLLPRSARERVLFIPQGSLFLVPFPALQSADGAFLIERHTLLTAPSIQALALTEQRDAQRQRSHEAGSRSGSRLGDRSGHSDDLSSDDILIVGNPTMPAIALKPGQPPTPLAPLPGSEAEALAIAQTLNVSPLIGDAATETAIRQRLPQANWIHLATHGLLDYGLASKQQTMPGALAFSPDRSPTDFPDSYRDGLLTATEIINFNISADLVVLSACDTGRGEVTGDGVVGLARAWLGAGAPSLVVSLWAVSDESTAMLMKTFYDGLSQDLDKATALRQAILTTAQQYDSPFDWAAFSLMGEGN